jgi:hypothetical protein
MRRFPLMVAAALTQALLPGCNHRPAPDPVGANLSVLGVHLETDTLEGAQAHLAPNPIQHNGGDAAASVHFICYAGPDGTHLFLTSYEIDGGRVGGYQLLGSVAEVDLTGLDESAPPDPTTPQCAELGALNRSTATPAGLHLGISAQQAEAILGPPDKRGADQLVWETEEQLGDEFQRLRTLTLRLRDGKVAAIAGSQATLN